ncbi:hypothetical protein DPMN_127191 [Dreissena polymorpha]|uniref:Uncharacterized protein n=1 Tax=Dreissena polymorpha TaxID=45954 RepID=A0A9D4H4S4_DREPO|nr:hypothetical protein DPMN_127191 [Dreissena polymorpha]
MSVEEKLLRTSITTSLSVNDCKQCQLRTSMTSRCIIVVNHCKPLEDQPVYHRLRTSLCIIVVNHLDQPVYYSVNHNQLVYNSVNHCKPFADQSLRNKLFIIVLTMSCKPSEEQPMYYSVNNAIEGQPFYYSVNHIIVDQAVYYSVNHVIEDQHDQPVYYSVNHCKPFQDQLDQPVYYNVNHCKPFQFQGVCEGVGGGGRARGMVWVRSIKLNMEITTLHPVNDCKQCQLRTSMTSRCIIVGGPAFFEEQSAYYTEEQPMYYSVNNAIEGQPFYYSVNHIIVDQAVYYSVNHVIEDQHDQPVYYSVNHCNKFEDQPVYYNVNHCKPFQFQGVGVVVIWEEGGGGRRGKGTGDGLVVLSKYQ